MRALKVTVLVSLAALTLGACGDDTTSDAGPAPAVTGAPATNPAAPTATADATPPATAGVPAALAFSAPLLDGTTFDGAALAGRTVAFWFWSPY